MGNITASIWRTDVTNRTCLGNRGVAGVSSSDLRWMARSSNKYKSVFVNRWIFVRFCLFLQPPRHRFTIKSVQVTLCDCGRLILLFSRIICLKTNNSTNMGGPRCIAENCKFGWRMYYRGRVLECQWIFGGMEWGKKKVVYSACGEPVVLTF